MSPVHFSVIAHYNGVTLWHCEGTLPDDFEMIAGMAENDMILADGELRSVTLTGVSSRTK